MRKDHQKINQTVQMLREAVESYYTGQSIMSDAEFDDLEEKLRLLEPAHPYFSEVGFEQGGNGEKVTHRIPMLSLAKARNIQEAEKWLRNLGYASETDFVVEPKVDGLSASLFYVNGRLRRVVTRGDGKVGQDVSHIVDYVADIPRRLRFTSRPVEIRGELHLPSDTAYDTGDKPLRNNCVGLINRKERREDLKYVRFLGYQILWPEAVAGEASLVPGYVLKEDEHLASEAGKLLLLAEEGFYTFEPRIVGSVAKGGDAGESLKEVLSQLEEYYCEYNDVLREKWNFETDGLVFMVNRCRLHGLIDRERVVNHHHHYALALKAPSRYVSTGLLAVHWQVSRQGNLVPVAIFEPMLLGGTCLQRASLHNADNVERLKLRKGDVIFVERANDVIPYVKKNLGRDGESGVMEREEGYRAEGIWPEVCPSCGGGLERIGVNIFCRNNTCRDRVIKQLMHWVRELGIEGVAGKTLEALYDAGKLRDINDLYRIGSDDFAGIEGFGPKKLENFLSQVEESRRMDVVTFITALGISMVQRRNLEKLGIGTLGDFLDFQDVSCVVGQKIVEWKSDEANIDLLKGLSEILDIRDVEDRGEVGVASRGVCLTGTGPVGRKELARLLEEHGWKINSAVTSRTVLLLCDDPGGDSAKLKKARAAGIEIQTYKDFLEAL